MAGARTDRTLTVCAALAVVIVCAAAASLAVGPAPLSLAQIWRGLTGVDEAAALIVRDIRAPRTILAIGVGATLGLAGAAIQALTRNPLAEPAVLGAPQAAALGATLTLYGGFAGATSWLLPLAAFAATGVATGLILGLAQRREDILSLLLVGMGVASLCGAGVSLAISLSRNPYAVTEIVFWLMGSFADRSMIHVMLAAPFVIVGAILLLAQRPAYRALTLGEDVASSLGVDLRRARWITALGVALGVGSSVAVVGAIGFVGLMAPHLVRASAGYDAGRTLAPAALMGALLTLGADILVRLIPSTSEIHVGVVTALIGGPWFLALVLRQRAFPQAAS